MQRSFLFGALLGATSMAMLGQRGGVAVPDAVTADPSHYSVSFENELVRLLRVRYGAGEKSVMHRHPASCAVFLTDQTFNFTLPDGRLRQSLRALWDVATQTFIFPRISIALPSSS